MRLNVTQPRLVNSNVEQVSIGNLYKICHRNYISVILLKKKKDSFVVIFTHCNTRCWIFPRDQEEGS